MEVKEYISKLCNKEITNQTLINLSSAQKSRLHSWMSSRSIDFNEDKLIAPFTIDELLSGNSTNFDSDTVGGNSEGKFFRQKIISERNRTENFAVGIDIQRIDELFPTGLPLDPKSDNHLRGIFSMSEMSYSQSKVNPVETLTGIFAVKEAVLKCTKAGIGLTDVTVSWDKYGAPEVSGYKVSLSHSGSYVVAVAIAINLPSISGPSQKTEQILNVLDKPKKLRKIDWVLMLVLGYLSMMQVLDYIL